METTTLTVSSQGQITIPKEWREILKLKSGTKLVAYLTDWLKGKAITLKPKSKSIFEEVAGTGKGIYGDVDEYIRKERESWERKSWD